MHNWLIFQYMAIIIVGHVLNLRLRYVPVIVTALTREPTKRDIVNKPM
jgi:hypothetical protein